MPVPRLVMGIDEVGYGPLLGPLVVSSCSFLLNMYPEEYPAVDLWLFLQESIGKKRKSLGNRLLVADSKKVYSRSQGIKQLERTCLTFANQFLDLKGKRFSQFLATLSVDAVTQLSRYPWCAKAQVSLPEIDQGLSDKLGKVMDAAGVEFLDVRCCYTDVDKFNKIVSTTNNKSVIILDSILEMIQQIISATHFLNIKDILILSDRIGGRTDYSEMLSKLPDFEIEESSVEKGLSKYKLVSKNRTLEIQFKVKADDTFLPVALASMFGKYVREKVMGYMNEYFIEKQPGLKPTAGYWTDGLRFLEDLSVGGTLDEIDLPVSRIVRIK